MRFCFFLLFLFFGFFVSAYATTCTWSQSAGGTYNWNDASNWSGASVPATGDDVVFNAPSAAQTIVFPSGSLTLNSIKVVGASGKLYTLDMTGFSLTVSGSVVRFTYVSVSASDGISITASDNVLISNSSFGDFEMDIIANSTTKAGGANVNNPATNNYTYQALQVQSSTFDGTFTAEARAALFASNTFNGDFTFTKKDYGTTNAMSTSQGNSLNTFNGEVVFTQQDNGTNGGIHWADRDIYNGKVTFTNNSANANNSITINPFSGTTNFNSHCYFYNLSSSGINISNGPSCVVNFSKEAGVVEDSVDVFFYNSGTGNVLIGNSGGVNFNNCRILLGNTSSGQVRISSSGASNAVPVVVESNCSINAYPDAGSVASGFPYFSSGRLYIDNLDLKSSSSSSVFSVNGLLEIRQRCIFSRDTYMKANNFVSISGIFNGVSTFINSSSSPSYTSLTYGWLHFYNHVSFINQSSNTWNVIGNASVATVNDLPVSFNSVSGRSLVLIDNQSTGSMTFGYNKSTVSFNAVDLMIRRNSTSFTSTPGNITVGQNALVVVDEDSRLFIDQSAGAGASQNQGIYLGSTSSQYFNFSGTFIACGSSSGSANDCGETFPSGTPSSSGLANSFLYLNRFNAKVDFSITTPSSADATTAVVFGVGALFDYDVNIKVQNFGGYGGTFNDKNGVHVSGGPNNGTTILHIYGNGSGSRVFTGTYTFNGATTLINESLNGNSMFMGNNSNDKFYFNSDLLIQNVQIGAAPVPTIKLCRNSSNTYLKGNLRYEGEFGSVPFGWNGAGVCYFNGAGFPGKANSQDQRISCTSTNSTMAFTKMEVDKTTGKVILDNNIKVIKYSSATGNLSLKNGNVWSNPTGAATPVGYIIMSDDATVSGGGKHSFVEGPFNKQGDDAFTFPIGKPGRYYPVSMTTPSNNSGSFTAEFFYDDIPVSSSKSAPLQDLLDCQYWKVSTNGTATTILTFCWHNASGQNCEPVDANTVTVARYNGSSWVDEGANALVSSPGDSGTVRSNTQAALGYYTLGSTLANTITPNEVYAVLKSKMDGSYYEVIDGTLYFRFEEEYAVSGSLSYMVYDELNQPVSVSTNPVSYGDNRYAWDASSLTSGKYYVLEVKNSKKQKWTLRFKV